MFDLKNYIRTIPDYPKEGIMFRDITTLLNDELAFHETIKALAAKVEGIKIDRIVAIESRGFIFGAALAYKLNKPLVLIRKKGKLPHKTISQTYKLEYGEDSIEIHEDAIKKNESVIIVDDLLATGGTAEAAAKLVEKIGGKVTTMLFVINLPTLKGYKRIEKYNPKWLIKFDGE